MAAIIVLLFLLYVRKIGEVVTEVGTGRFECDGGKGETGLKSARAAALVLVQAGVSISSYQ